jgi:diguanylate cyclase (GGDEF)-like protein/PAS domain S-box-containing protein
MLIPAETASPAGIDFQQSVDAAAIGIAHFTSDGFFLYANAKLCAFIGYTQDKLCSLNLTDVTHPGDMEAMFTRLEHMLDGEADVASPEKRFLHKRGHMLWATVHISLVRPPSGAPQYFVAAVQDIEKEKRAEQALLDRKAILRATFDQAPIGITHISSQGYFIRANRKFTEMVGYSEQELFHMHIADLSYPDDRDIGLEEFQRSVCGDISTFTVEKRYLKRGGKIVWVRLTVSSMRDAETGQHKFNIAVIEDISQRKYAEEALRESEARFRVLVEHTAQAVWETNADGNVVSDSSSWRSYTGQTQKEWQGSGWLNAVHPEDRQNAQEQWRQAVAQRLPLNAEFRLRCARSEWCWTNVRAAPLLDAKGAVLKWVGMNIDISDRKLAEERLHESEEFHRITAEAANVGIWEVRIGSDMECVMSPLMANMLGLEDHKPVYAREEWEANIFPEDRKEMQAATQRLLTTESLDESSFRVRWRDGSVHYLVGRGKAVRDRDGKVIRVFGASIDLTEQRKIQEDLHIANERLRLAIECTGDGLWDWNFDSNTGYISDRFKEILGYLPHELPNHITAWPAEIHPDDDARVMEAYQAYTQEKNSALTTEYRIACNDGGWKWVLSRGVLVRRSEDGRPHRLIGMLTDISDRKKADERIWRHANFDSLTQLPNRRLFRDRLEQEVRKAQRTRSAIALLFLDLDRFKQVNDLLGHDAGDVLLIQAAQRINSCVRDADTVARLGGDEFTVILAPLEDAARVEHIAQKILTALSEPFRIGTEYVYVSGSAGIALFPDDAESAEELIRKADQAMYAAKNNGKNQFSYFTRLMDERAHHRLRLISELRRALDLGQLSVAYQPVVELATDRVIKAEALMRWHHPLYGNIEPAYFVPLAEEAGLILEMGDWIFREAASSAKRWSHALGTPFLIGVNKSPLHFLSKEQDTWVEYLREVDLPAQNVTVEITEGVLMHASNEVFDRLLEYRDAGIQVALDDFGVGYSSMSYLKKFDIDYLKIDQSFVQDMEEDENSRTIAESIIVMAHRLGLKVIAEGVETDRQREILAEAECDFGQGYLFSIPLAAQEFEKRFIASEPRYLHSR